MRHAVLIAILAGVLGFGARSAMEFENGPTFCEIVTGKIINVDRVDDIRMTNSGDALSVSMRDGDEGWFLQGETPESFAQRCGINLRRLPEA